MLLTHNIICFSKDSKLYLSKYLCKCVNLVWFSMNVSVLGQNPSRRASSSSTHVNVCQIPYKFRINALIQLCQMVVSLASCPSVSLPIRPIILRSYQTSIETIRASSASRSPFVLSRFYFGGENWCNFFSEMNNIMCRYFFMN